MKGKIVYGLLFIVTLYLGILYYSPTFLGIAAVEILLPIVTWGLLQMTVRGMQIHLYLPISVVDKEQQTAVGIEMKNRLWFPVAHVQAQLRVQNLFYAQSQEIQLQGMADGKGKTRLTTGISSSKCGPVRIELQEVWIYDLLRLFRKKLPVQAKEQLAVLPEMYTAFLQVTDEARVFTAESEEYDKKRPGDDPSEVFQIREYREGDRIQSIHWKVSARTDSLMVKEYSLPTDYAALLFLDMGYQPEEDYGDMDEFLEAALAISQGLSEAGIEHYVVWYDRKSQEPERLPLRETDDRYILIEQLFCSGPYEGAVELTEVYREKYRGDTWHTQLLLNLKGELWKDGELQIELRGNARELLESGEVLIG